MKVCQFSFIMFNLLLTFMSCTDYNNVARSELFAFSVVRVQRFNAKSSDRRRGATRYGKTTTKFTSSREIKYKPF